MRDADRDPGLPIKLHPCSNGEYLPRPTNDVAAEAMRRARAEAADLARRSGVSRRRFLLSSAGAAAGLAALQACSSESGGGRGGRYSVPAEATVDETVADTVFTIPAAEPTTPDTEPTTPGTVLAAPDFVFDVQTHLLEYQGLPESTPFFGAGFPQASCGEADPRSCFSMEHWMEEVFLRSDTTMAVISAVPIVGDADPLSIEVMARAQRTVNELCGDGRVLIQGHAVPDVGPLDAALDAMSAIAEAHPIVAWKTYTHSPTGWSLDDHDPAGTQVGEAFLERVEQIGVPIVAVHKGLSGGNPYASPEDVGPAAAAHPQIAFLAYHSGFEAGVTEGPYDPDGAGVDRLVRSVEEAGIEPGSNVYAELGSTWRTLMSSPDEAAHVLGKLLVAVGADNVLWGTDSIWYGSPQDQIQAFRAFEITEELQERHGYPALTDEIKAKVLGGNAARLYGVDPDAVPCRFEPGERSSLRTVSELDHRTFGPVARRDIVRTFLDEHPWIAAASRRFSSRSRATDGTGSR